MRRTRTVGPLLVAAELRGAIVLAKTIAALGRYSTRARLPVMTRVEVLGETLICLQAYSNARVTYLSCHKLCTPTRIVPRTRVDDKINERLLHNIKLT
jgi:hypothetical protein